MISKIENKSGDGKGEKERDGWMDEEREGERLSELVSEWYRHLFTICRW